MTRIEKLLKKMEEANIEAALISERLNVRYLSGFTGSSGYLYISRNEKILLTDFRYIEQGEKECLGYRILDFYTNGIIETLKEIINKDGIKNIGFEDGTISYRDFLNFHDNLPEIELVELNDLVEEIRMIKDETEIENIKKAAEIGDKAFTHILNFVNTNVSEIDLAIEIEFFMRKNGATKVSFDPIVASGARSSLPHAVPTKDKIKTGEFLLFDFGCIYNGYCSDMTRTIVVGKASEKQKEIYNTVLMANMEALNILKEGYKGMEIDKVARTIIDDAGYKENFGHSLGHSLGLFIHEAPRLSPKSEAILKENMIVTVEPGIYIKDFGGVRIEDLVCVKKEGYENFVKSPKELIEL